MVFLDALLSIQIFGGFVLFCFVGYFEKGYFGPVLSTEKNQWAKYQNFMEDGKWHAQKTQEKFKWPLHRQKLLTCTCNMEITLTTHQTIEKKKHENRVCPVDEMIRKQTWLMSPSPSVWSSGNDKVLCREIK